MHQLKTIAILLAVARVGVAGAVPAEAALDAILASLFDGAERQEAPDAHIRSLLEQARRAFRDGFKPALARHAPLRETLHFLADTCASKELAMAAGSQQRHLETYERLATVQAPAIDGFLHRCKLALLEGWAPRLADKLRRDDAISPFLFKAIDQQLNGPDTQEQGTQVDRYARAVAEIMLELDPKAIMAAARKLHGGRRLYDAQYERYVAYNCRQLLAHLDPRASLYGLEFSGAERRSQADQIVAWNWAAQHCRKLLTGQPALLAASFKILQARGGQ